MNDTRSRQADALATLCHDGAHDGAAAAGLDGSRR